LPLKSTEERGLTDASKFFYVDLCVSSHIGHSYLDGGV
jgi:hypothetical protein